MSRTATVNEQLVTCLHGMMMDAGITKSELARIMGVDEKVVRRLCDHDHENTLESYQRAYRALFPKFTRYTTQTTLTTRKRAA